MKLRINLLPPEYRKKKRRLDLSLQLPSFANLSQFQPYIPIPLTLVAMLYMGYVYISKDTEINQLNQKKDSLNAELQKYQEEASKIDRLKQEFKNLEAKQKELEISLKLYGYITSSDIKTPQTLKSLIDNVPYGLWLENISLSADKTTLSGYSFSPKQIVDFSQSLSGMFEVNLNSTDSKTGPNEIVYYSFNIDLRKKEEGGKDGNR